MSGTPFSPVTYLLDTNALVFAGLQPNRVPGALLTKMRDRDDKGFISASSLYEIGWKHRAGRLGLSIDVAKDALIDSNIDILSVSADVMIVATELDWDHRDPWDRIIAAQSLQLDLPLISADSAFDAVPGLTRLWT